MHKSPKYHPANFIAVRQNLRLVFLESILLLVNIYTSHSEVTPLLRFLLIMLVFMALPVCAYSAEPSIVVMPPIKRVGVMLPYTNTNEFINKMSNQSDMITGVLFDFVTEDKMKLAITKIVSKKINETGRFWQLSLETISGLLDKLPPSELSRIEKQYDIDAWIKTEIFFAKDHTLIKIIMNSAKNSNQILSREDVVIKAMPTLQEIETNVGTLISRITTSLEHDGQITFTRNNLVATDIGSDSGLHVKQRLSSGLVLLSKQHPVTGEFLNVTHLPVFSLEVIEVNKGSSLCKIVGEDSVAKIEALKIIGSNNFSQTFLVWLPREEKNIAPIKNTILEAAPTLLPVAILTPAPLIITTPLPTPASTLTHIPESEKLSLKTNTAVKKTDGFLLPSNINEIVLGIGSTIGTIENNNSKISTGVSGYLINTMYSDVDVAIYPKVSLQLSALAQSFSATNVDGYKLELSLLPSYNLANFHNSIFTENNLFIAIGPVLTLGNIQASSKTSEYITDMSQEFSAVDIKISSAILNTYKEVGDINFDAQLSLLELISGNSLGLGLNFNIIPYAFTTLPLGFSAKFNFGPGLWKEISIGIFWKFENK